MRTPKKRGDAGQATLEFALTLVLLMSTVFFFIHSAFGLAWNSYVQYATYMSARAYLSSGPTRDEQVTRARNVAMIMLKKPGNPGTDRLPMIARGDSQGLDGADDDVTGLAVGFQPAIATQAIAGDAAYSWMEGVRYRFKSRLFLLPLGGTDPKADGNQLKLQSESWLGREPSVEECRQYFTETLSLIPVEGASTAGAGTTGETAVLDNGC